MARLIEAGETFDGLRAEVYYTSARLEDEPDAAELAARTAAWLERIDATEAKARVFQREEARGQAKLDGANHHLDVATVGFGDKLFLAVGKDRESARWRAKFRGSVTDFKRQPLAEQAGSVRGWLSGSSEPLVSEERPMLESAAARAEAALAFDQGLAAKRGNVWTAREELAAYLTRERDTLEDELAAIARAKGHDRLWQRSFFRATRRNGDGGSGSGGNTP